jgi:hypothetical protein
MDTEIRDRAHTDFEMRRKVKNTDTHRVVFSTASFKQTTSLPSLWSFSLAARP